jgi:hypothetical protein
MSQSRKPTPARPPSDAQKPVRRRRKSASTADGLTAQREALAERERQTEQAMTAARRLNQPTEPRP